MTREDDMSPEALDSYLAGESSQLERERVEAWIRADSTRDENFRQLPVLLGRDAARDRWDIERALEQFRLRSAQKPQVASTIAHGGFLAPWATARRLAMAALFLFGIATALTLTRTRRDARVPGNQWVQVRTGPGETRQLHLSDGSVARLGAMTTLRYAQTQRSTDVEMTGLAGFDVVHNAARVFRVRAGNAEVTDIGTAFVVRAYSTDTAASVIVSSGKVALSARPQRSARAADTIELDPGEGGIVLRDGRVMGGPSIGGDLSQHLTRLGGRLSFDAREMTEVAADLSNWFGVTVVVADSSLAKRRITAVFNKPGLTDVLDALSESTGARYDRRGDTITFAAGRL